MEMKLELVPVPVSDIDRAKAFYAQQLGFNVDHDVEPADGVRVVQLTPSGSGCSIVLSEGFPQIDMEPGSLRGLHLVVADIHGLRDLLLSREVGVSEVEEQGGVLFAYFDDPEGNSWVLQEIPSRQ